MHTEPILKVENVVKKFGEITALDGVSINVNRGEIVCFLGPSGCGKTTLLRVIGGFYDQDAGDVTLDGDLINGIPPEKRDTVMFFQNYALFPHMTVFENVTYGLRVRRVPREKMKSQAEEILALIQLEGMEDRFPNQLSGGQQQRVALARALILNPKLLLLDEPLSNLDAKLRSYMREEIIKIRENLNLTIIFVTHDQEEAMSIADKIAVMRCGVIEQIGRPVDIYRYPESTYVANFVGSANFLKATVTGSDQQGSVEIDTKMGSLKMTAPPKSYSVGDRLVAVIRPESIKISFDNNVNSSSMLQGEILRGSYLGSQMIYTIRVREEVITVNVPDPKEEQIRGIGDTVCLILPEYIHLIDAEKAGELGD